MRLITCYRMVVSAALLYSATPARAQRIDTIQADPRRAEAWAVTNRPALRIGAADGAIAETFARVVDVAQLNSGIIVVADALAYEVRFFSPEGKHIRSIGRQGRGPGEFTSMTQLLRCGPAADQVIVKDGGARRYTIVSVEGVIASSSTVIEGLKRDAPMKTLCGADQKIVALSWPEYIATEIGSAYRPLMEVVTSDFQGRLLHRIGRFPGQERQRLETSDRPRVLGKSILIAVTADRIYVATNDAPTIDVLDFKGVQRARIRVAVPAHKVSKAVKDTVREEAIRNLRDASRRPQLERHYRDLAYPSELPFFSSAVTDEWGRLWIQEYPIPGAKLVRWLVFNPDHTLAAKISTPREFDLRQVGRDWLLGITTDNEGVQRIEKYRYGFPKNR